MDAIFTYVVKEEIIRNVLRTHNNVLVVGWSGTGKTVSTLKASKGQGEVYYYSASGFKEGFSLSQYNDEAKALADLRDFDSVRTGTSILIIDGLDKLDLPGLTLVGDMISDRSRPAKIILIAPTLMDANTFLSNIDGVVRLKKETAEMTFSNLCNMGEQE